MLTTQFVYTPHGKPQALHAGRLAWGSGLPGEKPEYTGLDVIIVRDDKIAAFYVFLDNKENNLQTTVVKINKVSFRNHSGIFPALLLVYILLSTL